MLWGEPRSQPHYKFSRVLTQFSALFRISLSHCAPSTIYCHILIMIAIFNSWRKCKLWWNFRRYCFGKKFIPRVNVPETWYKKTRKRVIKSFEIVQCDSTLFITIDIWGTFEEGTSSTIREKGIKIPGFVAIGTTKTF